MADNHLVEIRREVNLVKAVIFLFVALMTTAAGAWNLVIPLAIGFVLIRFLQNPMGVLRSCMSFPGLLLSLCKVNRVVEIGAFEEPPLRLEASQGASPQKESPHQDWEALHSLGQEARIMAQAMAEAEAALDHESTLAAWDEAFARFEAERQGTLGDKEA